MVGGVVVDVWRWEQKYVSVVVEEDGKFLEQHLKTNHNSLAIGRGDTIWWISDFALWTPKGISFRDRHIPRIGPSFSSNGVCEDRANAAAR